MTFIPIEVQIPSEQILSAVEKMSETELDIFVERVLQIRGRRQAANLSTTETTLLDKIIHCIPANVQTRFNQLVEKRQASTINDVELQELRNLSNQIELLEAERIQHLAQLAQLQSISIEQLMPQLNLVPVHHD